MKTVSLVLGLVLLALGVACFIPGLATDGTLFGMFPVSTALAIAFIVTGFIGVMIGLSRDRDLPAVTSDGHDLRNF
jgi:hypothetical protein